MSEVMRKAEVMEAFGIRSQGSYWNWMNRGIVPRPAQWVGPTPYWDRREVEEALDRFLNREQANVS